MIACKFYDVNEVADELLKFAVIVSKQQQSWVFCKHKERSTYECPGGHREAGETIGDTATRELWEETGAVRFAMEPVCVYSVVSDAGESYGMLYYADILEFGPLPALEMEKIELFQDLPNHWTYPLIQPKLVERVAHLLATR